MQKVSKLTPQSYSRHPLHQRPHIARLHPRPRHPEPPALLGRQPHALLRPHLPHHMLAQVEAHADRAAVVAHDEGDAREVRLLDPVPPRELHVRHQQAVAARAAEAGLERHEHPGRGGAARDAPAVEQLDPGDDAPPQAHVLGERPAGEEGGEPLPERAVVAVAEPRGAVNCLELDEGQKGGDGGGGGLGEQVVGHDEVERVVHCEWEFWWIYCVLVRYGFEEFYWGFVVLVVVISSPFLLEDQLLRLILYQFNHLC
jgi:hypothetical protein